MDQKKRDKIAWVLAIVLTPVLFYLLYTNVFSRGRKKPTRAAPTQIAEQASASKPDAKKEPVAKPRPPRPKLSPEVAAAQKDAAAGLPERNPFERLGSQSAQPQVGSAFNLKVSAVIAVGSGARMAMINGKMYEQGDRIGEWLVVKVGAEEVVFERGDQRKTVSVK